MELESIEDLIVKIDEIIQLMEGVESDTFHLAAEYADQLRQELISL